MKQLLILFIVCVIKISPADYWKHYGGFNAGEIKHICADGSFLLAAGKDDLLYRSTDGGERWEIIKTFGYIITSILQTGSRSYLIGTYGQTLFRTTDGGNSWSQPDLFYSRQSIYTIKKTSSGKLILSSKDYGISTSDDAGVTWSNFILNGSRINDILILSDGKIFLSDQNFTLYRSDDDGNSFLQINSLPSKLLKFAEGPGNNLYFSTEAGIFKSSDFGLTITAVNFPIANRINAFIKLNNNESLIGFSRTGISRTTTSDFGKNWQNTGITDTLINCLTRDNQTGYLYAGSKFGVSVSTDNGLTWSRKSNGINTPEIDGIGGNSEAGAVFVYSFGRLFKSDSSGKNFFEVTSFPSVHQDSTQAPPDNIVCVSSNIVIVQTFYAVYRSTNSGVSWTRINIEGNSGRFGRAVFSFNNYLYMGSSELNTFYTSKDSGLTWQKQLIDGTDRKYFDFYRGISSEIYAVDDSLIYGSPDSGKTWPATMTANLGSTICGITFEDSTYVWVVTKIRFYKKTGSFYFYPNRLFALPISPTRGCFASWAGATGIVLSVATTTGFYEAVYFSSHWYAGLITTGLLNPSITSVNLLPGFGTFASTKQGLFGTPNITEIHREENKPSSDTKVSEPYPNPATTNVTVNYSTSKPEKTLITVYSLLGETVKFEELPERQPGEYQFNVNTSQLPSGTYFIALKFGNKTVVKKVQLLK